MRLPQLSFDPLATAFAALAAVLLVVFVVLLGATEPRSHGAELPYTAVQRMAAAGQIRRATQLDYDHRLLVTDRAGKDGWTRYPANGALQDQLLSQLSAKGATVVVDSQSGKQARRLIVQVLLPILILAALFALFMRLSSRPTPAAWAGSRARAGAARSSGRAPRAGRRSRMSPARAAPSRSTRSCATYCVP